MSEQLEFYLSMLVKPEKTEDDWDLIKNFESRVEDYCSGNRRGNRPTERGRKYNKFCKQCKHFTNGCKAKKNPNFSTCNKFKPKKCEEVKE